MGKKYFCIGAIIVGIVVLGVWLYMINSPAPAQPMPSSAASDMQARELMPENTGTPASETESKQPVPQKAVKEFTVAGQNFSFFPSAMIVKKGDTVKIVFKNGGGIHDFVIDEFRTATKRIGSGQEDFVQFVADKTGTFEYYCSVDGHRALGMKGILTVQ